LRPTGKTITTRTEARFCPKCFQVLNAYTNLTDDAKAEPGDYTVCIGCGSILRFTETMEFELSSLEAIPIHMRMLFARVVQAVHSRPPNRRPIRIT